MVAWLRTVLLLLLPLAAAGCMSDPGWSLAPSGGRAPMPGADASPASPGTWDTSAFSHAGRPIQLRRVGTGPHRVLWIGGIHGTEPEGALATEQLPAAMAETTGLLDQITMILVRDLNPDGRTSDTRGNARGVDLNRNFPARNFRPSPRNGPRPLSEHESRFLHDLFCRFSPHLVFVAHSTRRGPFINFDGPGRHLALEFAKRSRYRVVPSRYLHATPGSLGSWIGVDRGIPILTIEWKRGTGQEAAWRETRDAILAVLQRLVADTGQGP